MDGMRVEPVVVKEEEPALRERKKARIAPPFSEVLKSSVMKVNQLELEADELTNKLSIGEVDDISQVSIAVEKAELALRLMVQIRDKMVDAYNQISRMGA